jgi:hypothetical protein
MRISLERRLEWRAGGSPPGRIFRIETPRTPLQAESRGTCPGLLEFTADAALTRSEDCFQRKE